MLPGINTRANRKSIFSKRKTQLPDRKNSPRPIARKPIAPPAL
jgi:hypothetical protein